MIDNHDHDGKGFEQVVRGDVARKDFGHPYNVLQNGNTVHPSCAFYFHIDIRVLITIGVSAYAALANRKDCCISHDFYIHNKKQREILDVRNMPKRAAEQLSFRTYTELFNAIRKSPDYELRTSGQNFEVYSRSRPNWKGTLLLTFKGARDYSPSALVSSKDNRRVNKNLSWLGLEYNS
jgi:hypothetical protein